jgi:hypothetical protein
MKAGEEPERKCSLTDEVDFILEFGIDEEIARRNEQPKLAKKLSFIAPLEPGLGETRAVMDPPLGYPRGPFCVYRCWYVIGAAGRKAKSSSILSSQQVRRYSPTQARRVDPHPSLETKLAKEGSILWGFTRVSPQRIASFSLNRQNGGGGSPERTGLPARFPAIRD